MELRTADLSRLVPDRKWRKRKKMVHSFADSTIEEALSHQNSVAVESSAKS
jgi:hypothetical protein